MCPRYGRRLEETVLAFGVIGHLIRRDDAALPTRGMRSAVIRWTLICLVIVGLAAAAGMAALMIRLSQGPMRVDSLGQRIAAALDERTGNRYVFDLGATMIEQSSNGPTLVIDDFRVRSGAQTVIEAPRAEVSIDPLSVLTGNVQPRRVQVSNIDINLIVLPDGSVSVASGQNAAPIAVTPAPSPRPNAENAQGRVTRAALLAQAGVALRNFFEFATSPGAAIGAVEHVAIKSGRLIVEDKTADRKTVFEDLDLEFDKEKARTDLVVRARGPNGPLVVQAHAQGVRGELRTLDLSVKDISFDEIVLAGGIRNVAVDTDVKLAASARFALDGNGHVREANASFGLGSGYVRLLDPDHEPYFIDEVAGSAHWDTATRRIVIDPTHLFAADTRLSVVGAISPPTGGEESWRVSLGLAEPGTLSAERPGERVLPIDELGIEGTVLPFSQRAVLSRAAMKGPDLDIVLDGSLQWTDGAHIRFNGQAGQGPLRAFLRVWPSHVAANLRSWMIGHTHGGIVRGATMSADFDRHALLMMRYNRPPPDDKLRIDFNIAEGSIDTVAGLPALTGLDASVHITGRTLQLKGRGGSFEVSPGRRIALLDGQLDMPQNDGADSVPAHLTVRAGGPVEAAAELLSRDAMRSVAQLPVDPNTLHGKLEGQITADFEIGPAAKSSNSVVSANLTATDFAADRVVGKERLEGATVTITNDAAGFKANGNGRLFGGPVTFELRRPTGQPATATANLVFDDAARTRVGFPLPGVTGPIGARVNATLGSDATKAQVELDLTRTGIENGIPGLAKPAGKPAKLNFMLDQRGSSVLLDQLVFEGGGALAKGVVELASDGGFQSARFSQMRLSPGDDFRADIQKGGEGVKIAIKAVNLDARPFLKFVTQPGNASPGAGGDFDLELKAPVVTGFGKQAMSNVDLRVSRRSSTIRQFTLNGGFGRKPVVASMSRSESNVPQVNVATPDAGALLAFTDLYQRMEGGALSAVLQVESGRVTGTLHVHNFVLRDEPALRRLVVEGVPQQPPQNGGKPLPKVDANQVQFDRLQVVFTHANGRLDIRDGLMNGQMLGLTVEGSIDDKRDALDLTGTYVPAYGINNLFAKIPVVGLFLGGDWNEGLFAVNYHITGRPSAPVLSINPLSAVAPGFLRKLFGALDGAGRQPNFRAPTMPQALQPPRRNQTLDPFQGYGLDPSGRQQ